MPTPSFKKPDIYTFELRYDKNNLRPIVSFSAYEKKILRPIAEVMAMLDGNGWFGLEGRMSGGDFYEEYLPEAFELFTQNGGYKGHLNNTSILKKKDKTHGSS